MNRRDALGALFAAPLAAVVALKPAQDVYGQPHVFSPAHELAVRAQQLKTEMETRIMRAAYDPKNGYVIWSVESEPYKWDGSVVYTIPEQEDYLTLVHRGS